MVIDDQFLLFMADWNYGIDRFDICLQWFIYWLMVDYIWCFMFQWYFVSCIFDSIFIVDWFVQGVYYVANEVFFYFDRSDVVGMLYMVVFMDVIIWAYEYYIYVVFFQVQNDCLCVVIESYQFISLCFG